MTERSHAPTRLLASGVEFCDDCADLRELPPQRIATSLSRRGNVAERCDAHHHAARKVDAQR